MRQKTLWMQKIKEEKLGRWVAISSRGKNITVFVWKKWIPKII